MNTRPFSSLCRRAVVVGGFALLFPMSGLAEGNVPPEALNVKVYPDHYVAAGKSFANLASLQAWAKPILIHTVWLDFCGTVSTERLVAAVARFHTAYSEGIQVRTLSLDDARCVSAPDYASRTAADEDLVPAEARLLASHKSNPSTLP